MSQIPFSLFIAIVVHINGGVGRRMVAVKGQNKSSLNAEQNTSSLQVEQNAKNDTTGRTDYWCVALDWGQYLKCWLKTDSENLFKIGKVTDGKKEESGKVLDATKFKYWYTRRHGGAENKAGFSDEIPGTMGQGDERLVNCRDECNFGVYSSSENGNFKRSELCKKSSTLLQKAPEGDTTCATYFPHGTLYSSPRQTCCNCIRAIPEDGNRAWTVDFLCSGAVHYLGPVATGFKWTLEINDDGIHKPYAMLGSDNSDTEEYVGYDEGDWSRGWVIRDGVLRTKNPAAGKAAAPNKTHHRRHKKRVKKPKEPKA